MSVREAVQAHGPIWLAAGGLVIGFAFGAIVARTNFCTMGALSDIHNLSDWRRFRSWMLAAATALAGTQALEAAELVELSRSMYLAPNLNWAGHILGGSMFGFGMVFAGGCPSRNLARAGGGDIRALLTLVILGMVAYMAIGGILGPARAALEQATSMPLSAPTQSLGAILGPKLGLAASHANAIAAAVITATALVFCFANPEFRTSRVHVLAGVGVGLCVIAGWLLTGLAFDELADRPTTPISLTFVRPTGDTLEWLQRYTAQRMPGFGIATVLGAILGAFIATKAAGRFRLQSFAGTADTMRSMSGAVLMGLGGVMALGCTVGQGVTGIATLAIGSLLTLAALIAGGFLGLRVLERRLMAEG